MNQMVEYMVNLLFSDIEETEEVRALHDEVLANCNEHYNDLLRRGVSENDALAAVTESLQGMEEVLAGYPRKKDFEKAAGAYRVLELRLTRWDAKVLPSSDGRVHVNCTGGNASLIDTRFEQDRIVIEESKGQASGADFVQEVKKVNWSNFDDLVTGIRGLTEKAFRTVVGTIQEQGTLNSQSGTVVVEIPATVTELRHHSIGGDLLIEGLMNLQTVDCSTTSGDLELRGDPAVNSLRLKSTSGDIIVNGRAAEAEMSTMSGDLELNGSYGKLKLSTISGDIEVRGETGPVQDVQCKTVSGDIEIRAERGTARINAHSTSGKVEIGLPPRSAGVHTALRSVSGQIRSNVADAGAFAEIQVTVETVSGGIRVMG